MIFTPSRFNELIPSMKIAISKMGSIPEEWINVYTQYEVFDCKFRFRVDCMDQTFNLDIWDLGDEKRRWDDLFDWITKVVMTLWGEP